MYSRNEEVDRPERVALDGDAADERMAAGAAPQCGFRERGVVPIAFDQFSKLMVLLETRCCNVLGLTL